jgi:hypothetical protein
LDEHNLVRISPNSSNLAGIHRRLPIPFRTTKARKREKQQQHTTAEPEKEPLIERGLASRVKSTRPPPRWREREPSQPPPDAAEKRQIEQPQRREERGLIGEEAWHPSPPPPHLLPPEASGDEEENQEHPDPAHGIWTPASGKSPKHGIKPARPTAKT